MAELLDGDVARSIECGGMPEVESGILAEVE